VIRYRPLAAADHRRADLDENIGIDLTVAFAVLVCQFGLRADVDDGREATAHEFTLSGGLVKRAYLCYKKPYDRRDLHSAVSARDRFRRLVGR
jgi:hypothetical protein